MCLVTFRIQPDSKYPFILIHNREEFHQRPTQALSKWASSSKVIYGGRDLEKGGTWLAMSQDGRLASLINHPFTQFKPTEAIKSRGLLATKFLEGDIDMDTYLRDQRKHYEGHHFLYGNLHELHLYSNVPNTSSQFKEGTHSISNTLDDLSSFRKERSKHLLENYLSQENLDINDLIHLFQDRKKPEKITHFPKVLNEEVAREHASIFIQDEEIGTRSTTAILVNSTSQVMMKEVNYDASGQVKSDHQLHFQLESS